MKNRNLVSLSVTFVFLSIGITGILMYFGARGGITTIHVIFGLIFVAVAIFHVVNNWNLKPELLTEWFASSGGIKPNFEGATPAGNFFLNTKTTAAKKFSQWPECYNLF